MPKPQGDAGIEPSHGPDLEHETGRLDGGGERLTLLDAHAERLLDEHVLAGLDRLERHRHVELVGDRDDDGIDPRVGEHPFVVRVGHLRLVRRGDVLEQVFGGVAQGVELGVASPASGLEVRGLGDLARAEDADPQARCMCIGHPQPPGRDTNAEQPRRYDSSPPAPIGTGDRTVADPA